MVSSTSSTPTSSSAARPRASTRVSVNSASPADAAISSMSSNLVIGGIEERTRGRHTERLIKSAKLLFVAAHGIAIVLVGLKVLQFERVCNLDSVRNRERIIAARLTPSPEDPNAYQQRQLPPDQRLQEMQEDDHDDRRAPSPQMFEFFTTGAGSEGGGRNRNLLSTARTDEVEDAAEGPVPVVAAAEDEEKVGNTRAGEARVRNSEDYKGREHLVQKAGSEDATSVAAPGLDAIPPPRSDTILERARTSATSAANGLLRGPSATGVFEEEKTASPSPPSYPASDLVSSEASSPSSEVDQEKSKRSDLLEGQHVEATKPPARQDEDRSPPTLPSLLKAVDEEKQNLQWSTVFWPVFAFYPLGFVLLLLSWFSSCSYMKSCLRERRAQLLGSPNNPSLITEVTPRILIGVVAVFFLLISLIAEVSLYRFLSKKIPLTWTYDHTTETKITCDPDIAGTTSHPAKYVSISK
ncbi:unnamed protein product [Amoebophrya sp. A120]|nr:unnamed protein product [Amoebophrya sp. A120]|eukprot:GSA120T00003751001.1